MGVGRIEATLGDHICGVYSSEFERDQVVIPFLEAGLESGDKCICVVDGTPPREIVAILETYLDASAFAASKQLEVIGAADMYLRSGRFSADEVISSWKAAMSDVMYDGRFDTVRAVETWSRRDVVPDMHELLMLESEMNRYLPLYPQVIVCLYDTDRFGGGIIIDLLKTHPRVLVGETLLENPYYLTPDELLTMAVKREDVSANTENEEAAKWFSDVTTGST
nr:MEDS domain-containing protein [Pseudonocardia acidicola]